LFALFPASAIARIDIIGRININTLASNIFFIKASKKQRIDV